LNALTDPTTIQAAARGAYFIATMLLFGDFAFSLLLHARLPVILAHRDMRLRWCALAAAVIAALVWLAMATWQMAGTLDLQTLEETVTASLFGRVFLLRVLAFAALAFVLRRHNKAGTLLAMAALVLPSVTSHAAASSPSGFIAIGAMVDGAHLASAGFWLGGIALLLQLHRRKEPNMLLALSLFSEWAMIAVLLLVMSGLIDGASILLGDQGKPSSLYLAILGSKLALVGFMLGLAAMNRFRLMPKGEGQAIARNAKLELAAGFIVVLLAGVLGQLQPSL